MVISFLGFARPIRDEKKPIGILKDNRCIATKTGVCPFSKTVLTREKVLISLVCQGCGKRLQAPEKAAGKKLRCPSCATAVEVPVLRPKTLKVVCGTCGKHLKANARLEGRRVACPLCEQEVLIQRQEEDDLPGLSDMSSLLDEAETERSQWHCPQCQNHVSREEQVCPNCQYDRAWQETPHSTGTKPPPHDDQPQGSTAAKIGNGVRLRVSRGIALEYYGALVFALGLVLSQLPWWEDSRLYAGLVLGAVALGLIVGILGRLICLTAPGRGRVYVLLSLCAAAAAIALPFWGSVLLGWLAFLVAALLFLLFLKIFCQEAGLRDLAEDAKDLSWLIVTLAITPMAVLMALLLLPPLLFVLWPAGIVVLVAEIVAYRRYLQLLQQVADGL